MKKRTAPSKFKTALPSNDDEVIARTKIWLERAVIGLNLCPFAQSVYVHQRIRYCVSSARTHRGLQTALALELQALQSADTAQCETTLLIHPRVLSDFVDYNEFLGEADRLLRQLKLEGILQIASFHPRYQFTATDPDDIVNYTNRSPYPMLHLLREASVERAVSGPAEAAQIVDRNLATLRRLGLKGWRRLGIPASGEPV